MKFSKFCDKSLIMGSFLSNHVIQSNLEKDLSVLKMSFLGSLILLAIFFEDSKEKLGPSRLAATLGFSRSRISQEITLLQKKGLLSRSMSPSSARDIFLKQTAAGERKSQEIIRIFSRLQVLVDKAIGEKNAEVITADLMRVCEHFTIHCNPGSRDSLKSAVRS